MYWFLVIAILLVGNAHADVVRKQKTTAQFMGANEATTTQHFSADRSADESTTKWTRGFMKTMSGGKPMESKTIVRLDKEVVWNLDPKKKTYTEMTFAEYRDQLKKSMAEMEDTGEEAEEPDTTMEDMYEWTTEDKSDPNPKTINGWACRNAHVEATGVNKQEPNDKVVITLDMWNSPEVPGAAEIAEFNRKYLEALGIDVRALTPGLMQATALYEKQFAALSEAAPKAPGESVQSLIEIKHYQPKGKSIGKAAQEELMSKMPFGRKKKTEEAPAWEWKVKFSSTSELTEANTNPVDTAVFEIPEGFKKKDK